MAGPRNKGSALAALAAAGGLWAWQNRGKIQSWINSQRSQMQSQMQSGQSSMGSSAPMHDTQLPMDGGTFTGETRRIGAQTYGATSDTTDYTGSTPAPKRYDPEI